MRNIINTIYERHTKQSQEVIEKWMDRDYFMTAEEAVSFGIVDMVLREAPADKSKEVEHSKSRG